MFNDTLEIRPTKADAIPSSTREVRKARFDDLVK